MRVIQVERILPLSLQQCLCWRVLRPALLGALNAPLSHESKTPSPFHGTLSEMPHTQLRRTP